MQKTLNIQILCLALLLLIAGCDRNKVSQDAAKTQSALAEQQREFHIRQKLIEQQEAAETRSNLEFQAFQRANILFNAHEYQSASTAYHIFIRDFTLSPRVPIVQERLKDVDRILTYQKAAALAQTQAKQAAQAAAVAQAQEDARLRSQYQVQAPAQKNSGFFLTDTARGTGQSKGDAYASARQKLPAGAEEIGSGYEWSGSGSTRTCTCTITYRR